MKVKYLGYCGSGDDQGELGLIPGAVYEAIYTVPCNHEEPNSKCEVPMPVVVNSLGQKMQLCHDEFEIVDDK